MTLVEPEKELVRRIEDALSQASPLLEAVPRFSAPLENAFAKMRKLLDERGDSPATSEFLHALATPLSTAIFTLDALYMEKEFPDTDFGNRVETLRKITAVVEKQLQALRNRRRPQKL